MEIGIVSDWVDFRASVGLLVAGLALTNPIGVGFVVLGGTVYGIVRLAAGDNIDQLITYEEYWAKRKELYVPDSLKLKETERSSFKDPIDYWFYRWFYRPPAREREVD